MPNRTERRAAERAARKLANKQQAMSKEPVAGPAYAAELPQAPISEARLAANRINAQLSLGPTSSAGKAISSMNALKHGLTGQTVVLAGEDMIEYNRRFDSYLSSFQPANQQEHRIVQSLFDCDWRLDRVKRIESAIFLKGTIEFADKFEDHAPAQREGLILAEIYLKYEKSLRNLNIQEARLLRTRDKAAAELLLMQKARQRSEEIATEVSASNGNGFDFSTVTNDPQVPLSDYENINAELNFEATVSQGS